MIFAQTLRTAPRKVDAQMFADTESGWIDNKKIKTNKKKIKKLQVAYQIGTRTGVS